MALHTAPGVPQRDRDVPLAVDGRSNLVGESWIPVEPQDVWIVATGVQE